MSRREIIAHSGAGVIRWGVNGTLHRIAVSSQRPKCLCCALFCLLPRWNVAPSERTDLVERSGFLLCVCGLVLVCGLPIGAQTLTITSGFDGSSGPFIRSEMIVATLTGAEPFRPVTILYGNAALPPFAIPGVATGQLGIDPMDLNAFGPWDGLGLFGPASPFLTDASGNFSAPLIIPTTFPIAGLPWSRVFQAVTLINPLTSPGGESFALSSTAVVVIDEPATDPFISEITPHIVPENAVTPVVLTIRGTGFLPQSTVVPTVTFTSTCDPALSAQGTVIQVIPDPMIPTETALLVEAPALVGMAQTPPATNSGPMTVTVSYATTGLYPNVGVGNEGTYTTPQTTETDPVFLVYQTTLIPVITDIDPKANPSVGGCPISITGSNFLTCGVVVFNPGPGEVVVPNPLIVSDTLIQLTPPAIPQSLTTVAVRNIDHVTVSPRQSLANSPVTDFAFFTYDPTALVVNSITLSGGTDAGSLVEGSGGVFMTISGTCQEVGGYTLLDADSGPSGLRLGSNILGLDADLLVTAAADMKITSPGNWTIVAAVPALPPGIAFIPPAPSSGGLTNTGQKQVQIVPPVCVVAGGAPLPHKAYAAIPGVEPGNVLNYFAASPPMIDHILPNNCGRLDGGQTITIKGSGFLTQDVTLPSSDLLVVPGVVFSGEFAPSIPAVSVTILDEFTLEVVTPDLSALVLTPPISTDIVITNPDGQQSDVLGDQDDFHFYPSLAGLVANNFSLAGPTVLVSTTTGPGGTAIVYTFLGDLTLPAGLLVNATGEHPFIIRVRGNVVIDGDIDLSGGTVTSGAFLVPAGGGAGCPTRIRRRMVCDP